jgi:cytochrome c oxidase assembly protein subunit 11
MTNASPRKSGGHPARTALICTGVAFGMLGASFAAVPLYDLFCKVTGFGGTPMTGTAGAGRILDRTMSERFDANVAPDKTAAYFVKIQCFCFTEHTLKPGESFEAPVVFYIDPEIADNRELDGVHAITLSFTYFGSMSGQPVA